MSPPTVSLVSPSTGPVAGGQSVTITGTGFTGATGVTIGGSAATGVTVVSDTQITATTPAHAAGSASVVVTTAAGSNAANTLYTYAVPVSPPTVSLVSPSLGPVAGGQVVTITGTGFTGATAVTIGGSAATGVTVVSDTQITATTPAHAAGSASVVVTTAAGSNTANTLYTYLVPAPAPTVSAVTPNSGPVAGGQSVTITGTGFTGATGVTIGGSAATGVTVVSDTQITATTPAHAAGSASVVVTTSAGSNVPNTLYTYAVPSTLSATPGTIPTLTVGSSASFTPVTGSGGTAPYRYAIDAATPLPAGLSMNPSTGEISGTPTGALTGGTFKVNVSDSSVPTQTVQRSFALTANPASTTISLQATPTAPAVGQTVVLSVTMGASAASGTVTFKDGATVIGSATLSGGKASFTSAALSAGTHSFTAVYSGDGVYAAATSSAVVVTPTARPNPTTDKNVRAIIAAQSAAAQRVATLQIDTVQRRLETLHDDDVPAFVNGLSVSGSTGQSLGAEACDAPWRQAQPSLQMEECRMRDKAGEKSLDKSLDKNLGKFSALSPEKDAPTPRNSFGALEGSRFNVWTAGSVIFGGVTVSALGVETKTHFTLSGITAGVDTKLMDGVKGGMAVSYSGQSDDIGTDGSKMNSRSVTGSLYGSWNVASKFFLDGTLGYGDMTFSSKRLDANAASFIAGDRRGKLLFGSLALSYDATMGPLKVSPYARLDVIDASLNAYAETGDANWTLSYDKATMASRSLVLGLRGEYGIAQSWGVLSPIWRAEYRRLMSGDLTQAMGYVAEGASPYALTTTASDRDTISAALGLKAKSNGDVTGSVEYLLSGGLKSGLQGQGMRGTLRIGF